jgi:hypothetical protein
VIQLPDVAQKVDILVPDDILRIGQPLRCPICGDRLDPDPWWRSAHWICPENHSYSNVRVLIAELRERGWLPA